MNPSLSCNILNTIPWINLPPWKWIHNPVPLCGCPIPARGNQRRALRYAKVTHRQRWLQRMSGCGKWGKKSRREIDEKSWSCTINPVVRLPASWRSIPEPRLIALDRPERRVAQAPQNRVRIRADYLPYNNVTDTIEISAGGRRGGYIIFHIRHGPPDQSGPSKYMNIGSNTLYCALLPLW